MLKKLWNFLMSVMAFLWVSLMAVIETLPADQLQGIQVNGWIAFLMWVGLMMLIIKKQPLVACMLSTAACLAFRWTDQGLNNLTDFSALLARMIMYMVIIGMAYWILKAVIKGGSRNTNRANIWEAPIKGHLTNEDNGWESSRDNTIWDYGYDDDWDDKGDIDDYTIDPEDRGPKLVSGSEEYWKYKEVAEAIYWEFVNARTVDSRRYYKARGDELKHSLIIRYGTEDSTVNSLINQFLDLRA